MKSIPRFKLIPEPTTDDARRLPGFEFAPDDVGTRHQLGGAPANEESRPQCPSCIKSMTFYGQLDSLNDEFCVADAGLIYVFICFDCNEVRATIEST